MSSQLQKFSNNVHSAIQSSSDIQTVQAGLPAYLLFVDGQIQAAPENINLLITSAELYNGYAATYTYTEQPLRAQALTAIALQRAKEAACLNIEALCEIEKIDYQAFMLILDKTRADQLLSLYTLGVTWASWLQARGDDWGALAQLPKIQAIIERVVMLNDSYQQGQAHLYLGVINTLLPQAMGGKPEAGKTHFKKAIAMSKGTNLMAKVLYAKQYARLTFNKALHDQLLTEVQSTPLTVAPEKNLYNLMAKQQAEILLRQSNDYF